MAEGKERIPYQPPEGKRFEVSRDAYTKERLVALKEMYREFQDELPFDVGLSLFGSLSKGKELSEQSVGRTDIDIVVFADRDEAIDSFEAIAAKHPEVQAQFDEHYKEFHNVVNAERSAKRYTMRGYLEKVFWEKMNDKTKSLEHSLPAVHAFFYTLPVESWRKNQQEFRNFIAAIFDPITPHVEMGGLHHMFHLNIGGMKKFRSAFFECLSQEPDKEETWRRISQNTLLIEKGREPDRDIRFPKSFDEAVMVYGRE